MGVVGDVALEWMLMWNWLKPLCTRASSQSLGPTCTSPPEGDAKKCRCAAMLGTLGSADATVAPVMRTPVAMVRTIRYRIDLLLAPPFAVRRFSFKLLKLSMPRPAPISAGRPCAARSRGALESPAKDRAGEPQPGTRKTRVSGAFL